KIENRYWDEKTVLVSFLSTYFFSRRHFAHIGKRLSYNGRTDCVIDKQAKTEQGSDIGISYLSYCKYKIIYSLTLNLILFHNILMFSNLLFLDSRLQNLCLNGENCHFVNNG